MGNVLGYGMYAGGVFELIVGAKFITAPDALHAGYTPTSGYEAYAFESFGVQSLFMGILMLMKGPSDRAVVSLSAMYHAVWAAYLATAGGRHALVNPSAHAWNTPPMVVHGVLAAALLGHLLLRGGDEKKEKGN